MAPLQGLPAGWRARWHWLIPTVVIAGLLAPIPFTDRTFASDWGNHLWLIWVQGLSIADLGEPSYFLQSDIGAFYPTFAFNGGSIYAVLGAVSAAASPVLAVFLAYAGALAAAYLAWTWLAMQAGLRGWRTQLPGCIAVTAPYAVSNLYGRGDIPEAIATAMIPLAAASALAIVREPRVRLPAAAAFVAAIAVLTGTHTLTLAWGMAFLALVALLFVACNWRDARERAGRGLTLIGLGAIGVGINAWILMPLLLFHDRLLEGDPDPISYTNYTDPEHLFSLFRDSGGINPEVTADVNTQLPVLALLWVLIAGAPFWGYLSRRGKQLALGLLAIFGAFLSLIMAPSLIDLVPQVLRYIQFPYRLLTYADLSLVGLIVLALVAMQRAGSLARVPVALLAAIAAFSFGLAVAQNFEARSWLEDREEVTASAVEPPRSWYAPVQFADASAPIVEPTLPDPLLLPPDGDSRDDYTVTYPPGPAGTAETNILTGPYLVDIDGARPVGRLADGMMVVRLPASPERPREVTVSAAWGWEVTLGRWLTVAALLVALVGLGVAIRRRRAPS